MRLELGSVVRCMDLPFGELADVVVDPVSRRVTHLVVQPPDRHDRARLVPVERARAAGDGIALDCSVADVEALEPVHESAYLRVDELPVSDPDWEIGTQDVLALPLYQEMDGTGSVIDPDPTSKPRSSTTGGPSKRFVSERKVIAGDRELMFTTIS